MISLFVLDIWKVIFTNLILYWVSPWYECIGKYLHKHFYLLDIQNNKSQTYIELFIENIYNLDHFNILTCIRYIHVPKSYKLQKHQQ